MHFDLPIWSLMAAAMLRRLSSLSAHIEQCIVGRKSWTRMAKWRAVMSDTDIHIWINIQLQQFIMSIKERRMIHKTMWKVCNDVKGLGHV